MKLSAAKESSEKNNRYVRKGSRTVRIVREKFDMELETFLRQKRENEFMTDAEIAKLVGVHGGTIQKNREKFNINCKLAGRRRLERDQKIYEMMSSGQYTLQAIGNIYGLTRERIRQVFNEYQERLDLDGNGRGSTNKGELK